MQKYNWKIQNNYYDSSEIEALKGELGCSKAFSRLLLSRGVTSKEKYISLIGCEHQDTPFCHLDIEKGAKRVLNGIKNGEKILIYGDYDADGVSSTALLYLYFKSLGADISYYIPSRLKEGYGMTLSAIDQARSMGVTLIVTVDTGITAVSEIEYASSLGIETVVTDHHECLPTLPDAYALIDPKRPDDVNNYSDYAGVGVAMRFAIAMESIISGSDATEKIISEYCDIAAIGTVADIMPINGENKIIVKKGIEKLSSGKGRIGILKMLEGGSKPQKLTAKTIGFTIAPRINAAGRMDSPEIALKLLLTNDEGEAQALAEKLGELNRERQAEELGIQKLVEAELEKYKNDKVLVVAIEGLHHGVIGIVCSRMVEQYKKPIIILSIEDGLAKGSCRSVGSFNIVEAITHCSELMVKYGGHEMAAGLTLNQENIDKFREKINSYAEKRTNELEYHSEISIDIPLSASELTLPFAEELKALEPFGAGNTEPLFMISSAKVTGITPMGGGKHMKLTLSLDGLMFECLFFSCDPYKLGIYIGDVISVAFTLDVNEYMGRKSVSVIAKDFKFDGELEYILKNAELAYKEFYTYGKITNKEIDLESLLPVRRDFVTLYNTLISLCSSKSAISYRLLSDRTGEKNILKLRLMLDIFHGEGLISLSDKDMLGASVGLKKKDKKSDLEQNGIYLKIKDMPR